MTRSKIVAIITGAIAVLLSVAYLLLVQILDFRGDMLPAPESALPSPTAVADVTVDWNLGSQPWS